ncbi:hypothetical protein MG293_004877 [Ovis ammon polii]|uniref:Uncharacterized protein n=1 Tax=Ovis ammon polii TaxID=230172 RepID=A0AAD4UEK2_OVIAM|nr:hypothetical protein MG293_004877 [Ovis ammon polii]
MSPISSPLKPANMTKATVRETHVMSTMDRSFTDQSTLQEDEQLGLSFMDAHGQSPRGLSILLGTSTGPGDTEKAPLVICTVHWRSSKRLNKAKRNARSSATVVKEEMQGWSLSSSIFGETFQEQMVLLVQGPGRVRLSLELVLGGNPNLELVERVRGPDLRSPRISDSVLEDLPRYFVTDDTGLIDNGVYLGVLPLKTLCSIPTTPCKTEMMLIMTMTTKTMMKVDAAQKGGPDTDGEPGRNQSPTGIDLLIDSGEVKASSLPTHSSSHNHPQTPSQEQGQPEAPGPSAHPDIATQQVAFLLQRFRTQGRGPPLSTSQEVWDRRWHIYVVVQRGSEKRRLQKCADSSRSGELERQRIGTARKETAENMARSADLKSYWVSKAGNWPLTWFFNTAMGTQRKLQKPPCNGISKGEGTLSPDSDEPSSPVTARPASRSDRGGC